MNNIHGHLDLDLYIAKRETLIWELRNDSWSPLLPGLEAQNRLEADFAEDYRQILAWFLQLFPDMGNLNQVIWMTNYGIMLFLNLPDLADIPAYVSPCAMCPDYLFKGDIPITVWNALPQGPGVLPPEDNTEQQAIADSYICDIIGPTNQLNPNTLIFPYDCNRPCHGVHLGCY